MADQINGAVVFAFLSGLCITCRIVLQKTYRLANDTKMTDIGYVIDEYLSMTFCALLTLLGLSAYQLVEAPDRLGDLFAALEYFRVELILFHPLYNFFSLMTLTFVASVTHSLLNVSKRVIGLLITLVWFHEPVTHRIMIGVVGAHKAAGNLLGPRNVGQVTWGRRDGALRQPPSQLLPFLACLRRILRPNPIDLLEDGYEAPSTAPIPGREVGPSEERSLLRR